MKTHHTNGCRQSKLIEHARHGEFPITDPDVEWWNKAQGTTVKVLGPKPHLCTSDMFQVTCRNCIAKLHRLGMITDRQREALSLLSEGVAHVTDVARDLLAEPPCVDCGFCCRGSVCSFGTWDEAAEQCTFLAPWKDDTLTDADGPVPRYRCSKHDEIILQPTASFSPAFGAGCCQTLCNPERNRIVRALERITDDQTTQS